VLWGKWSLVYLVLPASSPQSRQRFGVPAPRWSQSRVGCVGRWGSGCDFCCKSSALCHLFIFLLDVDICGRAVLPWGSAAELLLDCGISHLRGTCRGTGRPCISWLFLDLRLSTKQEASFHTLLCREKKKTDFRSPEVAFLRGTVEPTLSSLSRAPSPTLTCLFLVVLHCHLQKRRYHWGVR
jgi:hypothetical protein